MIPKIFARGGKVSVKSCSLLKNDESENNLCIWSKEELQVLEESRKWRKETELDLEPPAQLYIHSFRTYENEQASHDDDSVETIYFN